MDVNRILANMNNFIPYSSASFEVCPNNSMKIFKKEEKMLIFLDFQCYTNHVYLFFVPRLNGLINVMLIKL